MKNFIEPNWPAPKNIKAYSTTRNGGFSLSPFNSLNLGFKSGDEAETVKKNREFLIQTLNLPSNPIWIYQVHGADAIQADTALPLTQADAAYTQQKNIVCTVLTADCLPLLVCNQQGTYVAAIHAGWKGLAAGVIEATLNQSNIDPHDLLVWLGPGISQKCYEVGDEVKEKFVAFDAAAAQAFIPSPNQRWMANMYLLAKQRLQRLGVTQIYGGDYCTYTDKDLFYSYRRDNVTGRMASLIYIL